MGSSIAGFVGAGEGGTGRQCRERGHHKGHFEGVEGAQVQGPDRCRSEVAKQDHRD